MKKIGLLTFHFPINYGAVIQAYALDRYLKGIGHQVEVINYMPERHLKSYNYYRKVTSLKRIIHNVVNTPFLPHYLKKRDRFRRFQQKHFSLTERFKVYEEVLFDYDVVLTGSDQVFNINREERKVYFQPFTKRPNQKKIAYAPSFGISEFDDEFTAKIVDWVNDFDALSCRERSGAEYLSRITGKDVPDVLDPVFLLSKKEWTSISSERLVDEKYIFIYDLNGKKPLIDIARKIGKGYKVVMLSNDPIAKIRWSYRGVDRFIQSASVEDFISLMLNADYVVTDSFHGTAMSIIFKKEFFSYIALRAGASRIESLLGNISLEQRIIEDLEGFDIEKFDLCDFTLIHPLIIQSKQFLNSAINDEVH